MDTVIQNPKTDNPKFLVHNVRLLAAKEGYGLLWAKCCKRSKHIITIIMYNKSLFDTTILAYVIRVLELTACSLESCTI
jgi:hypothetical protein